MPHLLPPLVTPSQGHLLPHSHPHTPPEAVGGVSTGVGGAQDSRSRLLCRHCTQCMSADMSVYTPLSVCLHLPMCVCVSVYLFVYLSACLFVCHSNSLSIHLSVYHLCPPSASICLFICLSIHCDQWPAIHPEFLCICVSV